MLFQTSSKLKRILLASIPFADKGQGGKNPRVSTSPLLLPVELYIEPLQSEMVSINCQFDAT